MKILVAIDDSACSRAAVEEVIRGPWPAGAEIRLVSVIEYPRITDSELWVLPADYTARMEHAARDRIQAMVSRTVREVDEATAGKYVVTGAALTFGAPQAVLPEEADKWQADLLIIGSHGYQGFKRFWLGSVSQAVAARAGCSVRIARGPAAAVAPETMEKAVVTM
ncbi:MAG: universal stress protein [Blastocatellia bacterium]